MPQPRASGICLFVLILLGGVEFVLVAAGPVAVDSDRMESLGVVDDYRCRACIGLAEHFTDSVVAPAKQRYGSYIGQALGDEKKSFSGEIKGSSRERVIAEVHQKVDALCEQLGNSHEQERIVEYSTLRKSEDGYPIGSKEKLREAVRGVCPIVLEELDEHLSETALRALGVLRSPPKEGAVPPTGEHNGKRTAASSDDKEGLQQAILQPGPFCVEHGLCSDVLHHHIITEQSIAKAAERARAEYKRTQGSKPSVKREPRSEDVSSELPTMEEWFEAVLPAGAQAFLSHFVQWQTWRQLFIAIPWKDVKTLAYWKKHGRILLTDKAIRFHAGPVAVLALKYFVPVLFAITAVLMVTSWWFCLRNTRRLAASPTAPMKSTRTKNKSA